MAKICRRSPSCGGICFRLTVVKYFGRTICIPKRESHPNVSKSGFGGCKTDHSEKKTCGDINSGLQRNHRNDILIK